MRQIDSTTSQELDSASLAPLVLVEFMLDTPLRLANSYRDYTVGGNTFLASQIYYLDRQHPRRSAARPRNT